MNERKFKTVIVAYLGASIPMFISIALLMMEPHSLRESYVYSLPIWLQLYVLIWCMLAMPVFLYLVIDSSVQTQHNTENINHEN